MKRYIQGVDAAPPKVNLTSAATCSALDLVFGKAILPLRSKYLSINVTLHNEQCDLQ